MRQLIARLLGSTRATGAATAVAADPPAIRLVRELPPAPATRPTARGTDPAADRRVRLGGLAGEGALVSMDPRWARGCLRFPHTMKGRVTELTHAGEPVLYEGVLIEGGIVTRIVGEVHLASVKEVFTGVEVDAHFGDVPAGEMTVRYRG
jgi:hypothetical protein